VQKCQEGTEHEMIKSEEEWVVKKQEERGRRGVEMIRACNVNEDGRKVIQNGGFTR
jgi:hypothetical protein